MDDLCNFNERRSFRAFLQGSIRLKNRTGKPLVVELAPIEGPCNEKSQRFNGILPGSTTQFEAIGSKSYLTVFAKTPRGSRCFKVVDRALVHKRREYALEEEHYDRALNTFLQ